MKGKPDIPGFDAIEQTGETSRTLVWRARHVNLNRMVTLHILKPELAAVKEEVRGFVGPARSVAGLKHDNLASVYDVAERNGLVYLVQEDMEGSSAGQMLEQHGPLPEKQALDIAAQVADALGYAWDAASIVHRNLKPDNLIVDRRGRVQIADMSHASQAGTHDPSAAHHAEDLVVGTPQYMSPEQADSSPELDFRTDMYSLGASLYHMVTGKAPFDDHDPMTILGLHRTGELPNPRDVDPRLSRGCAQVIARLMARHPSDRYPSWREARRAIAKARAGKVIVTRNETSFPSTVAPLRRPANKAAAGPDAGGATAARQPPAGRVPPQALRAAAWLLLVVWWIMLTGYMLDQPYVEPLIRRQRPSPEPASAPIRPAPAPDATRRPFSASPAPAPLTESERASLATLERDIASALLEGHPTRAMSLIDREMAYPLSDPMKKAVLDLRRLVLAVADRDRLLTSAFRDRVGEEVELSVKGRRHRVLLQAMSGTTIRGLRLQRHADATVTNAVVFSLSDLDPAERARWLGAANTPARCAMKFLLHMRAGDSKTASVFAAGAGPLADDFAALARAPAGTAQP